MTDLPHVYVVPAAIESKPPRSASPRHYDPAEAPPEVEVSVDAARRQTAAFQLVVYARGQAVRNLDVRCEGPLKAFRAEYIHCPNSGREWPDPLPPFTPCDIPEGQCRLLWFDIDVPADAKPGLHEASVVLSADSHRPATARVKLRASSFVLPRRPELASAVGVQTDPIFNYAGRPTDPNRREALVRMHYEALLRHGLSPYPWSYDGSHELSEAFSEEYLRDERVTAWRLPYHPESDEALARTARRARELGVFDRCYWYETDEPVKEADYAKVHAVAERLARVVGRHRLVVPVYRRPDMPPPRDTPVRAMAGACNLWCLLSDFPGGKDEEAMAEVRRRQAMGEELWTYVCMGPDPPAANTLINQEGIEHRILFWQAYVWRCTGFLYWAASKWYPAFLERGADLWQAIATEPPNPVGVYGDGVLVYPGGPIGRDEPVESQRLKLMRRGVDDYSILKAYERAAGEERAMRMATRFAPGFSCYERLSWKLNGPVWEMMEAAAEAAPGR